MNSPSAQAEAASAPVSASDKAADFENFMFGDEPEEEEGEDGEVEGDDLDLTDDAPEDADEPADEPESPAIAPPVSLNAEEKATFSQLPAEAQAAWAASETRRNTQVQEATTKASEAQRSAEARAAAADVQAQAEYAERLERVGRAFAPQEPNRAHYPDDASYLVDCRQHDAALAQHDQFMQQVQSMKAGSQAHAAQIDSQARAQDLLTIPELADPTTRDDFVRQNLDLIKEIGQDPATFEQMASAQDFKSLKLIAGWKADSVQLKANLSKTMERVRAAKGKTLRPGSAPHADARADKGNSWQRVKTARTREGRDAALADYFDL